MNYIKVFLAIGLALSAIMSFSQVDYTLIPMKHIPQSGQLNPQFVPEFKSYVGLSVLGSIHFNAYSNSLSFSDLVNRNGSIDFAAALPKLKDKNYFQLAFNIDLFSSGFRSGKNYFSFNVTDRVTAYLSYPKSLIELMWEGNGAFVGQNVFLEGLSANFMHYREYSFGYAVQHDENWSFGVKAKYLNGKSVVQTEKSSLFFYTDKNTYNTYINGAYSSKTAGLYNDDGSPADYKMFGNKNHGMAIDIGATYTQGKWKYSANLLDFGFIKWTDNANLRYNDSVLIKYEGVKVNDIYNIETEVNAGLNETSTEFQNSTDFEVIPEDFVTTLNSSFVLGVEYSVLKSVDLAAYYVHNNYRDEYRPMVLVNANYKLQKWLVANLSYSVYGATYDNVGMGLTLKAKFFQIYFITNNIVSHFRPEDAKTVNYRFGINLIFSEKKNKRSKTRLSD